MTDKKKLQAAQKRYEQRNPGLRKERDRKRYMKRRGNVVKKEREDIKKDITDTKNYIKKIWGRETSIREISYQEMKKLGEELGMNIFNTKNFYNRYKENRYKNYTRICKYCKKYYDGQVKIKSHPRNLGVCPSCKKKSYKVRAEKRKIKIK